MPIEVALGELVAGIELAEVALDLGPVRKLGDGPVQPRLLRQPRSPPARC